MCVKFYELAVGARFVFMGRRYEKVAVAMAVDEGRLGNIFFGTAPVETEGEPLLLSPEEAARRKPVGWLLPDSEGR